MPRGHILDLRWNALLNDFRRSGLTQAEFCRTTRHLHPFLPKTPLPGTHPEADPREPSLLRRPAPHFLPVTILPDPIPATAASRQPLELLLTNGRRIAVAPGFDPQTLRQLIAVVEERPCSD